MQNWFAYPFWLSGKCVLSGYDLGSVNYFKAWYTQLFRSEWSSTWTSVLSMGFKCRHKFSVCKSDRDQTRELWWCMNLLLSYLILFVECRHNWFMAELIYDMAQMTECVASSISRWHGCKAEYYLLSCSTHSDVRWRDDRRRGPGVYFSEAATKKLLPQA